MLKWEEAAVCAAILDPKLLSGTALRDEHFADAACKEIWRALTGLHEAGSYVDVATLHEELDSRGVLPALDSGCVLTRICAGPGEPSAMSVYEDRILARWHRRRTAEAYSLAAAAAHRGDDPADALTRYLPARIQRDEGTDWADAMSSIIDRKDPLGIPSGFGQLDDVIIGYPRGVATIVAARPGVGKSAFLASSALQMSKAGKGVRYYTLEDSLQSMTIRLYAQLSHLSTTAFRSGADASIAAAAMKASNVLKGLPLYICDRAGVSAQDVIDDYRRAKRADVVIVDYIQLLRPTAKNQSTYDRITEAITLLGDAAKADGIAIIVAAQLNRQLERRTKDERRPQLSDLRDSGALEERSKAVLMLYRDIDARSEDLEVWIRKNSHGPAGECVHLHMDLSTVSVQGRPL